MQAASEGVGRVLEAVGAASGIVRQLQQHYAKCISPRVEESAAEAAACATGLAALVRAVEERVLAALQASLAAFFGQARRDLLQMRHLAVVKATNTSALVARGGGARARRAAGVARVLLRSGAPQTGLLNPKV